MLGVRWWRNDEMVTGTTRTEASSKRRPRRNVQRDLGLRCGCFRLWSCRSTQISRRSNLHGILCLDCDPASKVPAPCPRAPTFFFVCTRGVRPHIFVRLGRRRRHACERKHSSQYRFSPISDDTRQRTIMPMSHSMSIPTAVPMRMMCVVHVQPVYHMSSGAGKQQVVEQVRSTVPAERECRQVRRSTIYSSTVGRRRRRLASHLGKLGFELRVPGRLGCDELLQVSGSPANRSVSAPVLARE